MLGALLLIAVLVLLVAFAALVSTSPNRRSAKMPWWLAWVVFIPFLGPAVSGDPHDGDSGDGGGSDGFGYDSGGDGGGGGDGGE
jgi:hypothetical protein